MTTENTKLTARQQRLMGADQTEQTVVDTTETPTSDEAAEQQETNMTTENTQAAAEQTTETFEIPDTFEVKGRVNTNAMGTVQSRYNLLILDETSQNILTAMAAEYGFKAANDRGEFYVEVTMDARSRNVIRRGAQGNPKAVVTAILMPGDIVNERLTGHLQVTAAEPLTLKNAGRKIVRTSNAALEAEPSTVGGASLRRTR